MISDAALDRDEINGHFAQPNSLADRAWRGGTDVLRDRDQLVSGDLSNVRGGDARPLLLPVAIFMWMDIVAMMRQKYQDRFPAELQYRLEKMQLELIITNNYLKAVMLVVVGTVAITIGFLLPR